MFCKKSPGAPTSIQKRYHSHPNVFFGNPTGNDESIYNNSVEPCCIVVIIILVINW